MGICHRAAGDEDVVTMAQRMAALEKLTANPVTYPPTEDQSARVSMGPEPSSFPARSELSQMNVIALLEAALREKDAEITALRSEQEIYDTILREKDDIIQAQYVEIVSMRERLALAVRMLNEANGVGQRDVSLSEALSEIRAVLPPTSSNLGHG
jgi:hypothetical protein